MALYDLLYAELRGTLRAPSVRRETFQAWAIAESECADLTTGRQCRPSVEHLRLRMQRHPRTVKRCRELARLLDVRQVVFRGRHRTKLERLDSHKRDDPCRGWTAEAALIESPAYAHLVDNSTLESLLEQGFVTPLPRSGGSLDLSRRRSIPSPQDVTKGRAPRGTDKRRGRKSRPAYDQRAVKLAASVRRDERFPLWVREIPRGRMTAALTRVAVGGWDVDDVAGGLDEFQLSGRRLIHRPDNPAGYLHHILSTIPVDVPPARLDRARTVAIEAAEHAESRRLFEELRASARVAAGVDAPGRTKVRQLCGQIGERTAGNSAERARQLEEARRELARRARGER